jgi:hypothetical protein
MSLQAIMQAIQESRTFSFADIKDLATETESLTDRFAAKEAAKFAKKNDKVAIKFNFKAPKKATGQLALLNKKAFKIKPEHPQYLWPITGTDFIVITNERVA